MTTEMVDQPHLNGHGRSGSATRTETDAAVGVLPAPSEPLAGEAPGVSCPVLLYVPGIGDSEANTARRVAEVIADSASISRPGTYTVEVGPASAGGSGKAAFVLDQDKARSLEVVEVPFREEMFAPDGPSSPLGDLGQAVRYAIVAILRGIPALFRRAKTTRAKLQLVYGFAIISALTLAVGVSGIVAVEAFWPNLLPEWLTTSTEIPGGVGVAGTTVTLAGLVVFLRARVLATAGLGRALMRYVEGGRDRVSVTRTLRRSIDEITDQDPNATVHVLAYSFGSIVTLDALFPDDASAPNEDKRLSVLKTLVTVGAPIDALRLFYPRYFDDRRVVQPGVHWTNLFIPADVLGSSLLNGVDGNGYDETSPRAAEAADPAGPPDSAGDSPDDGAGLKGKKRAKGQKFTLAGVSANRSISVSRRRLKFSSILLMRGFRVHDGYWDQAHRANYLEHVISTWLPPKNAG